MKPYTSVSCGYEPENLLPYQVEKDDLNDDYKVLKENPSVPVVARVLSIESVKRSSSICVIIVGKSQC